MHLITAGQSRATSVNDGAGEAHLELGHRGVGIQATVCLGTFAVLAALAAFIAEHDATGHAPFEVVVGQARVTILMKLPRRPTLGHTFAVQRYASAQALDVFAHQSLMGSIGHCLGRFADMGALRLVGTDNANGPLLGRERGSQCPLFVSRIQIGGIECEHHGIAFGATAHKSTVELGFQISQSEPHLHAAALQLEAALARERRSPGSQVGSQPLADVVFATQVSGQHLVGGRQSNGSKGLQVFLGNGHSLHIGHRWRDRLRLSRFILLVISGFVIIALRGRNGIPLIFGRRLFSRSVLGVGLVSVFVLILGRLLPFFALRIAGRRGVGILRSYLFGSLFAGQSRGNRRADGREIEHGEGQKYRQDNGDRLLPRSSAQGGVGGDHRCRGALDKRVVCGKPWGGGHPLILRAFCPSLAV